ncbi:MAG: BLUF domain-containing protein [Burkholderiaceae bacterium]|jgi:hypothetical protein
MQPLVHYIYTSRAKRQWETCEFVELLKKARERNEVLGVTGMLLYAEGSFFQVLEGPPENVRSLFAAIADDRRHFNVTMIIKEPIPKRYFAEWTMAFSTISREELANLSGASNFLNETAGLTAIDAGRAKKLLMAFRRGRWRSALSGHGEVQSSEV